VKKQLNIPRFATVATLANLLNVRYDKLVKNLKEMGFENMSHNVILDKETTMLIADEYGFEINEIDEHEDGKDLTPTEFSEDSKFMKTRPPIVTIMGHVDHGKTTILDHLRKSSIVTGEHGGITQHIGAFSVKTPISKKMITFLDTPGHAAFLKMRERGANITDIVILVVAADDSVMPQTIEAIRHIKKSDVACIVAVNKCDKENANPSKVISDLSNHDIITEEYGGDIQVVKVSGLTGLNMDKLEETIITLAEILDLKAATGDKKKVPVEGWIIESQNKSKMGPLATVLIKQGDLKIGDVLVSGSTYCKVKSMKNEFGAAIKLAKPSTPVEIWGWKDVPEAGELILQAKDEKLAKEVVNYRLLLEQRTKETKDVEIINKLRIDAKKEVEKRDRLAELRKYGLNQEDLTEDETASEEPKQEVVNYIVKADVSGSVEAIVDAIKDIGNDEVKLNLLYSDVGSPTDTDLERAELSKATILGFNIKLSKDIDNKASQRKIPIKLHNVIYHLIKDVEDELSSKLTPTIELKVRAETEIKEIFEIKGKRKKVFKIAGCKVISGSLERSSKIRVVRDKTNDTEGYEVYRGKLDTLKHLKDDVIEVKKGKECGVAFEGWSGFAPGDVIQVFEENEIKRYL
jgi:translation initiation factor IF-2